jgi:hypothetical protein
MRRCPTQKETKRTTFIYYSRLQFKYFPSSHTFCVAQCAGVTQFAIRNSQFAIRNSQFAIRNSQFTIHNSQFAFRNSQFTIRNSQFTIRNSQFTIRNSQFAIRNSQFTIRNSHLSCLLPFFLHLSVQSLIEPSILLSNYLNNVPNLYKSTFFCWHLFLLLLSFWFWARVPQKPLSPQ